MHLVNSLDVFNHVKAHLQHIQQLLQDVSLHVFVLRASQSLYYVAVSNRAHFEHFVFDAELVESGEEFGEHFDDFLRRPFVTEGCESFDVCEDQSYIVIAEGGGLVFHQDAQHVRRHQLVQQLFSPIDFLFR